MAQSKLDILINAKDNASRQIGRVQKSLSSLDKAAGIATRGLAGLGAVAGVGVFSQLLMDAARAAGQFNTVKSSMDQLASSVGQSADSMLNSMRNASHGMINDTQLVLSANRAMMLGVADSADEMGDLLEVAIKRGAAMGLSAEQAFNDLVTGIGRMSPMILDNLGIVTGGKKVFDDYAASIGKSAEALSDAEKKQALLNSVIAQTPQGEIPVSEFERLDAALQNAKVAMGQLFAPSIATTAGQIADATNRITEALNNINDNPNIIERKIRNAESTISLLKAFTSIPIVGGWEALQTEIGQVEDELNMLRARLEDVRSTEMGGYFNEVGAGASQAAAGMTDAEIAAHSLADAMDRLAGSGQAAIASIAAGMFSSAQAADALAFYDSANHELSQMREQWSELTGGDAEKMAVLQSIWLKEQREVTQEVKRTGSAVGGVSSEYSKMQGIVSGIVSGAIGPVAGVDAEDFLPREDAVNENARRLADIMVNGFKGQDWMEEFKREVPDIYQALVESGDPQGAAARLLKDFQDGLVPELIDKNKAKELAKRALLGDQASSALAEEIAQELAAEMGVSLQKARAAAGAAVGGGTTSQRKAAEAVTIVPKIDTDEMAPVRLVGKIAEIDASYLDEIDCIPIKVCPTIPGDAGLMIRNQFQSQLDANSMATISARPTAVVDVPTLQSEIGLAIATGGGLTVPATVVRGATATPLAEESALIGEQLAGDISGGFGPAFDEQMLGQYIALSIASQVEENAALFEASGKRAAQLWGPGFLAQLEQDIPAGLVNALTGAVWNNISGLLNGAAPPTGATDDYGGNGYQTPNPDYQPSITIKGGGG